MASAPLGIAMALGLALLVNADIRGRDIYRTIIFISYPLMTVAVAIIWRWMFDERVGLINYVAREARLVERPIPFLNSFTWALPWVIAANIWQMLGFYMIILLTGLQNIPHNLYEAAEIDGAAARHLPAHHAAAAEAVAVPVLRDRHAQFVHELRPRLCDDRRRPGPCHRNPRDLHLQARFNQTSFDYAAAVTVVFFVMLLAVDLGANRLSAAMSAPWRTTDDHAAIRAGRSTSR